MTRRTQTLILAGMGLMLSAALVGCQPEEKPADTAASPAASPAAEATAAGTQATQDAAATVGKDAYEANCATCHMANGEGVPGTFPPIAGSERANGPAEEHIKVVLNGLSGPITVKGQNYDGSMPPFGHLSDQEIADILTYERTTWGNTGGAVTADQVKALR